MAAIQLSAVSGNSIEEILNAIERQRKDIEFIMANLDDDNITQVNFSKVTSVEIDQAQIKNLMVDTANIKDLAVSSAKIANAAITTLKVEDAAITNAKIDRLTADKLVVVTADIQDAAITNAKIDRATVNKLVVESADIKDAAITNAKIDRATANKLVVVSADIADAQINNAHIQDATIDGTAKIKLASITTGLIKDAAITEALISDLSVTDAKIVDLTATKLKTGTIDTGLVTISGTDGKLILTDNRIQVFDNQAVPVERVAMGDVLGDGTVYGFLLRGTDGVTVLMDIDGVKEAGITDGAITNPKIGQGAVKNENIFADTITGNRLVADAITSRELAVGAITAEKAIIANSTIGTAQIIDGSITNAKINDLDAAKITAGTISTDRLAAGSITADKLVMGDTTNLCENPDFESDADGANPKGFIATSVARVKDISAFAAGNGSNRALEVDASTVNRDIYGSNLIPVTPGQKFYLEAEGRYLNTAGTTGKGVLGFREYDAKKVAKSVWSTVAAWGTTSKEQTFTKRSGEYTVPAGTYYLQIWVSFSNNGEATNKFYIDNIRVHRKVNAELIVQGTITAESGIIASIDASKITAGTITGININGTTITGGTIVNQATNSTLTLSGGDLDIDGVPATNRRARLWLDSAGIDATYNYYTNRAVNQAGTYADWRLNETGLVIQGGTTDAAGSLTPTGGGRIDFANGYMNLRGINGGNVNMASALYLSGNTTLSPSTGNSLNISGVNGTGSVQIGPMNTSWCHLQTDRPSFYFNKGATLVGDVTLSGGELIALSQPFLEAGTETAQSIPSGAYTKLTNGSAVVNVGGGTWSAGSYTVPTTGRYVVYAEANCGTAAGSAYYLVCYQNGLLPHNNRLDHRQASGTLDGMLMGTSIINCTAGDVLEIRFYHNEGVARSVTHSYVQILKVC